MKLKLKNKIFSIISLIIIIVLLFISPFIKSNNKPLYKENSGYKAIIQIWNLDTFEGGVGSRTSFLRQVAKEYSNKHSNILFLVTSHSISSATTLIEKGEYPDIISYGGGSLNLKNLAINLNGFEQNDGGKEGKFRYMLAWSKGGYLAVKHKSTNKVSKVIVSEGEYNSASVAKLFSEYADYNSEVLVPSEAYLSFVTDKNSVLIGTQRDVFRLKSRELEFDSTPIYDYCDLFHYLSVINTNQEKNSYSLGFVNYLMSEKVQQSLYKIGMLSPNFSVPYDDNEHLKNLQNKKPVYTISPYADKDAINEIKRVSFSSNKINNIINLIKHL